MHQESFKLYLKDTTNLIMIFNKNIGKVYLQTNSREKERQVVYLITQQRTLCLARRMYDK